MNKKIKIVIVGGGTAGWMAAGYFSKYYGGEDITVIESPIIPKIGVGESVTPHVNNFFDEIGVDRHHWMKHTSAVYKFANKFVNWKAGQGETEYFSFTYTTPAKNFYKDITQAKTQADFSNDTVNERTTDYLVEMLKRKQVDRFDKYFNPQFHYMEKNVSPFKGYECLLNGPFSYSQHINAELAGKYIKDHVAIPRGVKHIVATVKEVDHNGDNINFLVLDDNSVIKGDLFIDCTGFHRALIKNLSWPVKQYEDHAIDSAWVCQTEYTDQENEMVNYTQSIAEPHGWRFKIGLYHRMGNGYCFSSKHISDDDALNHFVKQIGPQRTKPRLIKWQPTRLEKFGGGNIASVGLSCGFVEPLEANSLYVIITSIRRLFAVTEEYKKTNNFDFSSFNEKMKYTIDDIADFILVHYTLSSRDDTDFWKDMRSLGKKLNHRSLVWEKYQNEKNSMYGAITGYTLFPDYMWAQLAVSWNILEGFEKPLDDSTYKLAVDHYKFFETKHDVISDKLDNNYHWHKNNIFDNLEPKDWEQQYVKGN